MTGFKRGIGGRGSGRCNIEGRPNNFRASNSNVNLSLTPSLNQSSQPHSCPTIIGKSSQRASIETQLSRNLEGSVHPSSMDINSGGASCTATKKRGRGSYKSLPVDMKTKYGGKITADIPKDIDRAVGDGARDIANYCGLVVRTTVSFRDGDWPPIFAKHGQTMWLKVKDKFEVGGRQENVLQAFVISTTQRLFRAWKTRLHKEYLCYKTDEERLSHRPESVSPEDWKYLVQHFKSPKFQGRIQSLVTQQKSEENENRMTGDEILATVLGERTGYVRGKGYGKRPPRKNRLQQADVEASVSSAMTNVRQQMQVEIQAEMQAEMDRKLQEERETIHEEMDRRFQEQMRVEVDKRIQEQMGAMMSRMQQGQFLAGT